MKTLITLMALALSMNASATESKLEGRYEINARTEQCASAFEISSYNDCLVMEYGAAAAREFCRLNKGPKTVARKVKIKGVKMMEYRTVVETLFAETLTVSETVALKNKFGLTIKRSNTMATFSAIEDGLIHRESASVYEAMKAPQYKKRKCQYKVVLAVQKSPTLAAQKSPTCRLIFC